MITRRAKKRMQRLFVLIFVGITFILFISSFFIKAKKTSGLVSPLILSPSLSSKPPAVLSVTSSGGLDNAVKSALEGTKGTYGVFIKNLNDKETYVLNEHEEFDAGSLYKLWVMAQTFKLIESGDLKEDLVLTDTIPSLNKKFSISDEFAELTEGSITLTVSSALNQMITISHNYAALLLTAKIRLSSVDSFLKNNGFSQSRVGKSGESPTTTAYDVALFFEKLYAGELATSENTEKMINLLKNQKLNNKLPKNLAKGVVIAHKTGEIGQFTHDAGVVYLADKNYIIAVLSKSEIPAAAEDRIANISKNVYEYFLK